MTNGEGSLPHALGFVGGDQEALLEQAWRLAQQRLCETSGSCGQCGPCRRVLARQSEAVLVVEPEGNSHKLEAAQRICEFLSLSRISRARVVIVPEAQWLNPQATNALLKIVEEPPPETYFMFLLRDKAGLLPTLRSRLQFSRGSLTRAEVGPEELEWRDRGDEFLRESLRGQRAGLDKFLQQIEDRLSAQKAAQMLQRSLRDWSVGERAFPEWPDWEPGDRVRAWRWAHDAEKDISANLDRNLVFTNLYLKLGGQL